MKIAGIHAQDIKFNPEIQHAVSEPYGLEMILAVGEQEGHDVDLFLPAIETPTGIKATSNEEMIERIVEFNPDVACFSLYTSQFPTGENIAKELKKRIPDIINVAGNRYPTYLKEKIPKSFDFFAIREGEETFKELLEKIETSQDYFNVPGLVVNTGKKGVFTGNRKRNYSLNSVPLAKRFPIILNQTYNGIGIPPLSKDPSYAIMEYSRSCESNCNFCDSTGFWGNLVTYKTPERFVEEGFKLKEQGVDIVYVMDLNFTSNYNKAMDLCNEIVKSGLDLNWYAMSNVGSVLGNEDLLYAMKDAGCYKIAWGVESTCDENLQKMNKTGGGVKQNFEDTVYVLGHSLHAGIINQGYYIMGFPDETKESIIKDAQKIKDIPLHQLNIGIFTPIPLSAQFNQLKKEGFEFEEDLSMHDRNTLIYSHPSIDRKEMKEIQMKLHSDFYKSPEFRLNAMESIRIDSRFEDSFNDYLNLINQEVLTK
jgi:anaerobic magnesium-protoporphyrin IX monomethyl ester cyclase